MSYTANVYVKDSKECIEISDLQLIKKNNTSTANIEPYKDFENFFLFSNQHLCFVGSKKSLSINSDEIRYIEFIKDE